MTRYCPEYYSPDEIYPLESTVDLGLTFGPNGNDYTGTNIGYDPSPVGYSTGIIFVYGKDGNVKENITLKVKMTKEPTGIGQSFEYSVRSELSDVTGMVQFTNLVVGGTYRIWMGSLNNGYIDFVVPDAESFEITNFVGDNK